MLFIVQPIKATAFFIRRLYGTQPTPVVASTTDKSPNQVSVTLVPAAPRSSNLYNVAQFDQPLLQQVFIALAIAPAVKCSFEFISDEWVYAVNNGKAVNTQGKIFFLEW